MSQNSGSFEERFPTMRYLKCRKCGNVFVVGLSGARECPDCLSEKTDSFSVDDEKDPRSDRNQETS